MHTSLKMLLAAGAVFAIVLLIVLLLNGSSPLVPQAYVEEGHCIVAAGGTRLFIDAPDLDISDTTQWEAAAGQEAIDALGGEVSAILSWNSGNGRRYFAVPENCIVIAGAYQEMARSTARIDMNGGVVSEIWGVYDNGLHNGSVRIDINGGTVLKRIQFCGENGKIRRAVRLNLNGGQVGCPGDEAEIRVCPEGMEESCCGSSTVQKGNCVLYAKESYLSSTKIK